MQKEIMEYKIGKRHLANMMGEDPDRFNQADVDVCIINIKKTIVDIRYIYNLLIIAFQKAIEYLFPSGLYERKARPIMKEPETIFPERKAAQFNDQGRPFHSMFYTTMPNYYEALYVS